MKVLILVLSVNDGKHYSEFFETQKKTWDSIDVDDFKTFYYFGNSLENKIISKSYSVKDHTFFEFTTHYLVFRKNKPFQLFYIMEMLIAKFFRICNFIDLFYNNGISPT
jgi:hypothetical protein